MNKFKFLLIQLMHMINIDLNYEHFFIQKHYFIERFFQE